MEILFGALLLAVVAAFVLRPLLREAPPPAGEDPRVADLEARKESKYREIRDAQLDHASGKLSDADFGRVDADRTRNPAIMAHVLHGVVLGDRWITVPCAVPTESVTVVPVPLKE